MSLYFMKAGLQTSIQDLGRNGFMHLGVSQSGAMDPTAMKKANWLVNKPIDSPVIEITLIGPKIRFSHDTSFAICGAEFDLYLNGNLVFNDKLVNANQGDILEFDKLLSGARSYMAFSGKLNLLPMLNSYSTHLTSQFGGFNNRAFKDSDSLEITPMPPVKTKQLNPKFQASYTGNYLLRCIESVESCQFNQQQSDQFFCQSFVVTADSNRMGIRLKSQALQFEKYPEILSSGLVQGSIQIPPSGQAIISSVDGQTMGGYPRIANIISADLPLLGQLKAGDKINFFLVDQAYAINALNQLRKLENQIFIGQ